MARIESGAALASPARDLVMGGVFGERERVEPPGALLTPPRLKPFPARLFLLGLHNRKGAGAARRPHELPQAPEDGSHPAK